MNMAPLHKLHGGICLRLRKYQDFFALIYLSVDVGKQTDKQKAGRPGRLGAGKLLSLSDHGKCCGFGEII